jgi:hypothetical protein
VPKKYHRPPATKRRKTKKPSSQRVFEPLPESETDHSETVIQEVAPDDVDESYEDDAEEVLEPVTTVAAPVSKVRVEHLVTDYRYVVSELRLSLGLAAFLIVALLITAILR